MSVTAPRRRQASCRPCWAATQHSEVPPKAAGGAHPRGLALRQRPPALLPAQTPAVLSASHLGVLVECGAGFRGSVLAPGAVRS